MSKKDLIKIAKNMLVRHPRVLEYNLKFFKCAVKSQEGIELTDEEAKEVGKLILNLSKQKCPTKKCPNCYGFRTRADTMGFWICLYCGLVWKYVEIPTEEDEKRRKQILSQ